MVLLYEEGRSVLSWEDPREIVLFFLFCRRIEKMLNKVKIIVKTIIEGKEAEVGSVHTIGTAFAHFLRKEGL